MGSRYEPGRGTRAWNAGSVSSDQLLWAPKQTGPMVRAATEWEKKSAKPGGEGGGSGFPFMNSESGASDMRDGLQHMGGSRERLASFINHGVVGSPFQGQPKSREMPPHNVTVSRTIKSRM